MSTKNDTNGDTRLEQGVNTYHLQGQRQPDDTIAAVQGRLAFSLLIFLPVSDINQGQGNTFGSIEVSAEVAVAIAHIHRLNICILYIYIYSLEKYFT